MRLILGLSAIVLLAACNERGLSAGPNGPVGPSTLTPQSAEVCLTDGNFDFHVYGDGMTSWEGQRIAASAIENHADFSDPNNIQRSVRRPVQLDTRIRAGSFSIMCSSSLRENYEYPSYAVFIDVDGDGECGVADLGLQMQLYGWKSPVDDQLGVIFEWAKFVPVGELQGAIGGGEAHIFCQDYFP
jgi:hypothetical protein